MTCRLALDWPLRQGVHSGYTCSLCCHLEASRLRTARGVGYGGRLEAKCSRGEELYLLGDAVAAEEHGSEFYQRRTPLLFRWCEAWPVRTRTAHPPAATYRSSCKRWACSAHSPGLLREGRAQHTALKLTIKQRSSLRAGYTSFFSEHACTRRENTQERIHEKCTAVHMFNAPTCNAQPEEPGAV